MRSSWIRHLSLVRSVLPNADTPGVSVRMRVGRSNLAILGMITGGDSMQKGAHAPGNESRVLTVAVSFLFAEFRYANVSGSMRASLTTSRGRTLNYTAPGGCTLPSSMPVLLSLDHDSEVSSPVQRVDSYERAAVLERSMRHGALSFRA